MYPALVALMAVEIGLFLLFLVLFHKWTSAGLKIVSVLVFVGGMVAIATNKETPIEDGRMWVSIIGTLVAVLLNAIIGSVNKDTVK